MSKNGGNIFMAFLTGASMGAILGILYAPEKGKDTRDKLRYQLKKQKEQIEELINDLVDGKESPTSLAKQMGEKVKNDAIQRAEKIRDEITNFEKEFLKDK